jgi:hypothetical protein
MYNYRSGAEEIKHVQDESEKAHKMFTKVVKKAKEQGVNVGVSISMEFYTKK